MSYPQLIWLCLSMTDFGKNLSTFRKQRRLTQLALANMLDVQPRMVGRWEQGKSRPQFEYIIKLAQVLEVTIDQLVYGEQGPEKPVFEIKNKRLKELCRQVDELKPDEQEIICRFMDMAVKQNQLKQLIN